MGKKTVNIKKGEVVKAVIVRTTKDVAVRTGRTSSSTRTPPSSSSRTTIPVAPASSAPSAASCVRSAS
jgi:hypothetical protein